MFTRKEIIKFKLLKHTILNAHSGNSLSPSFPITCFFLNMLRCLIVTIATELMRDLFAKRLAMGSSLLLAMSRRWLIECKNLGGFVGRESERMTKLPQLMGM